MLVFATSHRAATHNMEPKPASLLCSFMPLILGGFHGCSHTQAQNEVAGLSGFLAYPKNGSFQVNLMDVELRSHCRSLVSVVTASECLPLRNDGFRDRKGFCCVEGNSSTKYLALWFHSKSERSHAARKHFQIPRQPQPKAGQPAGCPGLRNPRVSAAPSLGRCHVASSRVLHLGSLGRPKTKPGPDRLAQS